MRMRWVLFILVLLVIGGAVVVVLVHPATLYVSLGMVKQEPFFEGKPASYWARALKHEPYLGEAAPEFDVGKTLRQGGSAAIPVLCEIAQSADGNLRSEALVTLSLMGPEAKGARSVLETTLRQEKNPTRFMIASETLAQLDQADAVAVLDEVIQDPSDLGRRSWALQSLLKLGPEAKGALPALQQLFVDSQLDPVLRVQVIEVLWALKQPPEPLAAALVALATAPKSSVGVEALTVLEKIGPAAKSAVPALLELFSRPNLKLEGARWGPPHRNAVITALGSIGSGARAAVPALMASLKSGMPIAVRVEIAAALAQIGAKDSLNARDAAAWTSITLLAGRAPADLATFPLVRILQTTWVPRDLVSRGGIRQAIQDVDPRPGPRGNAF
jgi:HEAT repeat protein